MSKDKKQSNDMAFPIMILISICIGLWAVYRFILFTLIPLGVRIYFNHRLLFLFMLAVATTLLLATIAYGFSRFVSTMRAAVENRKPNPSKLRIGLDEKGKPVFVTLDHRKMHTQVIGTTNAGKTESVIVPWAVDDIRNGRGLILVDGKSDRKLLEKLWGYAVKYHRTDDFMFFSLADTTISRTFNPLIGNDPEEVVERVFSAMEFDNGYYKNVQRTNLAQILRIFHDAKEKPTFSRLLECITDPAELIKLADSSDDALQAWADSFKANPKRVEENSGLTSQLATFAHGGASRLFNQSAPEIDLEDVLAQNKIVYFQLPAMKHPFLGRATGKLILQALQSAVSSRHLVGGDHKFFSVYLDDFTEYLYESFVTLLNKSRSANVGLVFAHQAIGDLEAVGPAASNAIMTNSNVKIVMRSNAPDTAEYFAKVVGTKTTEKHTERKRRGFLGGEDATGDISARETEEYLFHPQIFKQHLGTGWAVVVLPDFEGTKSARVKLDILPDPSESKLIQKTNLKKGVKAHEKTA